MRINCLPLQDLAKYGIDESRRDNLIQLAMWGLENADTVTGFDMDGFCFLDDGLAGDRIHFPPNSIPSCGTVGCLLGHGPVAGISVGDCTTWESYCDRQFIQPARFSGDAWLWLFAPSWSSVDNSLRGGALRIIWMLEHGVPSNYDAQAEGDATLCYTDNAGDRNDRPAATQSCPPCKCGGQAAYFGEALMGSLKCDTCGEFLMGVGMEFISTIREQWAAGKRGHVN